MGEMRNMYVSTLVDVNTSQFIENPQPGDLVRYYMSPNSVGLVIENIDEEQVRVCWGNFYNPFAKLIHQCTSSLISAAQIGSIMLPVQSMSQGAILFYLDEV